MTRGKPFTKGKSGNPSGRPKENPIINKFKETTYADFIAQLQKYGALTKEEMKADLERKDATMFQLIFGKIVIGAANGDKDSRQVLLERLWGKVKETVQYSNVSDQEREKIKKMANEELVALVKANLPKENE